MRLYLRLPILSFVNCGSSDIINAMSRWKTIAERILHESHWEFARSSGPGGQNVNKVESKTILRWSLPSSALPVETRSLLKTKLESRLTNEGEIIIGSDRFRDREMNKSDVRQKLMDLIESALFVAPPRKKTKPTRSSQRRRLESKTKRKEIKRQRGKVRDY
jgi:ribosome-associated protein